jgi:hypothetical protein
MSFKPLANRLHAVVDDVAMSLTPWRADGMLQGGSFQFCDKGALDARSRPAKNLRSVEMNWTWLCRIATAANCSRVNFCMQKFLTDDAGLGSGSTFSATLVMSPLPPLAAAQADVSHFAFVP